MKKWSKVVLLSVVLAAPLATHADVKITEIMYDPEGGDSKREWVEIYNEGSSEVDLASVKFVDKSKHVLNAPPKNGGVGSMKLAPGNYAVLSADANVFRSVYLGSAHVIDTAMSLNNTSATISIANAQGVLDTASYFKTQGAAGDGDSLQLSGGMWIHAKPTPGAPNATAPSVHAIAPKVAAVSTLKESAATAPKEKSKSSSSSSRKKASAIDPTDDPANDPLAIVNATPTDKSLSQTAAAGTLGGSYWWFVAGALGLATAGSASLIARRKRSEWDIVEGE